jgi:hypothetical protein
MQKLMLHLIIQVNNIKEEQAVIMPKVLLMECLQKLIEVELI